MRYLFKALSGAVLTDTVPPGPGPALVFDIPRACTVYAQFSWAATTISTQVAFEVSIDGVNFFQIGPTLAFGSGDGNVVPNGYIATVTLPGCVQMRQRLVHLAGAPSGPILDVTWAVFDNGGLT